MSASQNFATILAAAILVTSPCVIAAKPDASWFGDQTANMTKVAGHYTNRQYGFSVTLPPNATAWKTTPPNPDHGVLIILGDHRTIEVSASYDAALYGSTSVLLGKRLRDAGNGRVKRSAVQLGGFPAERADVDAATSEVIVAQWLSLSTENAINYSVILATTVQARLQDMQTLTQIVSNYEHFSPDR